MIITEENRPVHFAFPDGDEVELPPWQYIIDRLELDLRPTINKLNLINTSLTSINNRLGVWAENRNYTEQLFQPVEYIRSDGKSYIVTDIAGTEPPLVQTVKFSIQRGFLTNGEQTHRICGSRTNGEFYLEYKDQSGSTPAQMSLHFTSRANGCSKTWYDETTTNIEYEDTISSFQFETPYIISSNSSSGVVTFGTELSNGTILNSWTGSFTRYILMNSDNAYHYLFAKAATDLTGSERNENMRYVNIYYYDIQYGTSHYVLQPCYRVSDEKVGVIDVYNNKFYPAIGNGEMFYGPAKGDTVSLIMKKGDDES